MRQVCATITKLVAHEFGVIQGERDNFSFLLKKMREPPPPVPPKNILDALHTVRQNGNDANHAHESSVRSSAVA